MDNMWTIWEQHVSNMRTTCEQHKNNMRTTWEQHVNNMRTTCEQHVNKLLLPCLRCMVGVGASNQSLGTNHTQKIMELLAEIWTTDLRDMEQILYHWAIWLACVFILLPLLIFHNITCSKYLYLQQQQQGQKMGVHRQLLMHYHLSYNPLEAYWYIILGYIMHIVILHLQSVTKGPFCDPSELFFIT